VGSLKLVPGIAEQQYAWVGRGELAHIATVDEMATVTSFCQKLFNSTAAVDKLAQAGESRTRGQTPFMDGCGCRFPWACKNEARCLWNLLRNAAIT
jgi:hypothetical protein